MILSSEEINDDCAYCGLPVLKSREDNWYEIVGWVKGPKKDSLSLRTLSGLIAHDPCISKTKMGQHPDDESMFDE